MTTSNTIEDLARNQDQHGPYQSLLEYKRRVEQVLNAIDGRLDNLKEWEYERTVRTKALARSQIVLGFDSPYVALNQEGLTDPRLTAAIARAVRDGHITPGGFSDIFETDIIISAENNRHAVVEVSVTADRDDIARAKSRAAILSTVTGSSVMPIVITARLNPAQSAQAEAENVTVFVIPYP